MFTFNMDKHSRITKNYMEQTQHKNVLFHFTPLVAMHFTLEGVNVTEFGNFMPFQFLLVTIMRKTVIAAQKHSFIEMFWIEGLDPCTP